MPVRVVPSAHGANSIKYGHEDKFVDNAFEVLMTACPDVGEKSIEILQTSLDDDGLPSAMKASRNGLVYSICKAYSYHHHLHIRPEDIWFAALSQFSFFINAHSEELRDKFVAHQGQKELSIKYNTGDRYSVDFGVFAQEVTRLIEENVIDPELRSWMMPNFTTSRPQDEVVASILMMGSVQKYFSFKMIIMCGIPSVTLLGEREDYERIFSKLDKFSTFGDEPTQFAALLKPIVSRMIRTFDDAADPEIIDFWQKILHIHNHGSGSLKYSGWISAFCFWDEEGRSLHQFPYDKSISQRKDRYLTLDDTRYHVIDSGSIPPGVSKVPVKVDDNGEIVDTEMVAGSVGISCSSSGLEDDQGMVVLDTMQPETGWWVYEKKEY